MGKFSDFTRSLLKGARNVGTGSGLCRPSEMIFQTLFSDLVSNFEKENIAKTLLLEPQAPVICPSDRHATAYRKQSFPSAINETTSLSELPAPGSWFFFQILQIDSQFLHESAVEWSNVDSYQ